MAVTNKQAAARLVLKEMAECAKRIDHTSHDIILGASERTRLTAEKATEIKDYAKGFLDATLKRAENICAKINKKEDKEDKEDKADEADEE